VANHREFDLIEFGAYLRKHGRWLALASATAVAAAAGTSLLLPKQYTATASVLIDPPAGNDPRASTALSPVYLDSLRTFERIASNDSLFVEALRRFAIPEAKEGRSVESLKRSILSVSKPMNTKILEIAVTLRDARMAQALAEYIARRTVALSEEVDKNSEEDVTREAREILSAAETRLRHAQEKDDVFTASQPVTALEADVDNASELEFFIRWDLADAEAQLAEASAERPASDGPGQSAPRAAALRARVDRLKQNEAEASRLLATRSALLEQRKSQRAALEAELAAARAEYESAKNKLNEIRASSMFRGERLEVIDPGIVPNRPSSPNLPLNVITALALALVGGIGMMAVRFGREQSATAQAEAAYPVVAWER
jgi:uncharacterized protein involved in exopolysaccharide biosynthesis